MKTVNLLLRIAAVSLAVMCFSEQAVAKEATSSKESDGVLTRFNRHKTTPDALVVLHGPGIYARSGNKLLSIAGNEMKEYGKVIIDADVNPYGNMFFLISNDGKKNIGGIVANESDANVIYTVSTKRLGNPSAVAYTIDALNIILASDSGINIIDAPTRMLVDRFKIPYKQPNILLPSSNNYFLAVGQGPELSMYNLEEKKLRKNWDFETDVNDVAFNDNNTEFAVATADGGVSIFDTRNFQIKKSIDDLEGALALSYNFDGKYLAVAETPDRIVVINLLDPEDREIIAVPEGGMNSLRFVPDSENKTFMAYTGTNAVNIRYMGHLTPYYARLISEEANERLNEWLKMMPGETMEEYRNRVNDESIERQRRLFEDEISTRLAPDMLTMATWTFGKYDRANGLLEVGFDNMPSILLPVPETDLAAFYENNDNLEFRNAKYGVMSDDKFELIYAEVYNSTNGKTYIFNNIERIPLNFMTDGDNVVSFDLILQQQMEEKRLEEMREKVVAEAMSRNVISDHTNISVNTRIDPEYDANGNKILNYRVNFTYEVDPGFTATEDFAAGKYHAEQSGAAGALLALVKEALETDFAQYVKEGKRLNVALSGTADATPIVTRIQYDGAYGDILEVPVYQDGKIRPMTIHPKQVITENEELAFLRAYGVKDYLNKNVDSLGKMNTSYRYDIDVAKEKGSEHRRITIEFTFIDAF